MCSLTCLQELVAEIQSTRRLLVVLVVLGAGRGAELVVLEIHLGRMFAVWVQFEFVEVHQVVLLIA